MTRPRDPATAPGVNTCPRCGERGWCLETRHHGVVTRRRYECDRCRLRWTTRESIVRADYWPRSGPRRSRETELGVWA